MCLTITNGGKSVGPRLGRTKLSAVTRNTGIRVSTGSGVVLLAGNAPLRLRGRALAANSPLGLARREPRERSTHRQENDECYQAKCFTRRSTIAVFIDKSNLIP